MQFHRPLLDIFNTRTKMKVIRFLMSHQALMSEREIASILRISHMSVNRIMRQLLGFNLVDYVSVGKAHAWKVNRRSYAFRKLSEMVKGADAMAQPQEDLVKTLGIKHIAEYESRLIYRTEAERVMKDGERFLAFVREELPKG